MPFCLPIVEAIWCHSNITLTPAGEPSVFPAESDTLGANLITSQSQEPKASLQQTCAHLLPWGELAAMRKKMHLFMSVVYERGIDKQEHLNGFKLPVNDRGAGACLAASVSN